MARGWKCPRCSTQNGEGVVNCTKCGLIQGGVFVPSSYVPPEWNAAPPSSPTTPTPNQFGSGQVTPDALPSAAQGVGAPLLTGTDPAQPSAGWVPPYPVAPPRSRPLWRRVPIGLLIFGVLVIGGAVAGFITNASRSSTGDITRGGDLTSNDLRVGDCWDLKDPNADTIDNVAAKPCGQTHEYEVFYIASMAGDGYPTEDAFNTYVNSTCVPAFETYVGRTYEASTLDISWLYPGSEGWSAGDRTVECSLYDPKDSKLTASLRSSRR